MNENFQATLTLRSWIFRFAMIFGLAIGIAGCSAPASTSSSTNPEIMPTPTEVSSVYGCDAKKVPVTNVHWFRDAQGAWRVVGVITNNSSKAVGKLVTGVETRDKNNQPADQGEDVTADTLNLLPGEQAPFIAWIGREIPNLDHFEVEVAECVLAEPMERGKVDVRSGRMVVDEAGMAQVTAELFNPGPKSVLINGLMAGVYTQSGALVAAENAAVATRYLKPGESGPVRVTLDLPPGSEGQLKSYKFFMDPVVNEPAALPVDIHRDAEVLTRYVDSDGHFHLVGVLTNSQSQPLMATVQATVYTDANKSSVADVAFFNTWIPLGPGQSLPFDLSDWGPLNNIHTMWNDISTQNPAIELRFEPFSTWLGDAKLVNLSITNGKVSYENQQAIFTGKAQADENASISNGLVIATIRQKSDRKIIATGNAHLDITGSAPTGQVFDYRIVVPLPPGLDTASIETAVTGMGQ